MRPRKNQTSSSSMDTTTTTTTKHLLQHPSHHHPLELLQDFTNETRTSLECRLCHRKIWTEVYTCNEGCDSYYYHKACVEAPPQIVRHPLHPLHPLTLIHEKQEVGCDGCGEFIISGCYFRCHECDFDLEVCCALSTLSDEGGSQGGKTSERITLPLHPHKLTSFSTRHDFVWDNLCYICRGSVEGEGYTCLCRGCEFIIHKRCIQDLYFADGTKAPRVYHGHPLEILIGEDTGSNTCASCGSDKSGELIGCASCQVFYHRHCFQVPDILRYPSHNPNHTLVLFPDNYYYDPRLCQSCSNFLQDEIYYRCTSCEFFVHVGCAFQVLAYCAEGMSAKIKLSWHKHPLLLCHQTESVSNDCIYCEDESIGPSYVCEEEDCEFLLHKQCTEIESTITHAHHPDHPLTLCERDDDDRLCHDCKACGKTTDGLMFSCERCVVDLHVKCAVRFPTHKHYLHEHELFRFEQHCNWVCNRCGRRTDSPLFRCVPCNFNLHEECMELPRVVKSKIHWHPLTLHDTFVEDDTGEYYCEQCEKTRDPRLGAYVCGHCELELPRIYHIECVLPELGNVYAKKKSLLPSDFEKLSEQIADKKEEVRATKEKLEELSRELDELVVQRTEDEIMKSLNWNV